MPDGSVTSSTRTGSGAIANAPASQNHESGQDHVGIYMLNTPEYIESMLGAYLARVAPFNVNYRYVDDELLYLLTDSDATGVIYQARYAPNLARIRERLPKLRLLIQLADESGEPLLPGALDYETALAGASDALPPVQPSPDDLYILYTGGTTGAPKGVLWRQEDIFHAAMTGRRTGHAGPRDRRGAGGERHVQWRLHARHDHAAADARCRAVARRSARSIRAGPSSCRASRRSSTPRRSWVSSSASVATRSRWSATPSRGRSWRRCGADRTTCRGSSSSARAAPSCRRT